MNPFDTQAGASAAVRPWPSSAEAHLRPDSPARFNPDNFRLIRCDQCGRPTYERGGRTICTGCRTAPQDNWWAVVYGGHRPGSAPRPQAVRCRRCGRVRFGPLNVPREVTGCAHCLNKLKGDDDREPVDGQGPPRHAGAIRVFVGANCANATADGQCLFRPQGCLAVRGARCGHFEAAVASDPARVPEKVRRGYGGGVLAAARMFCRGRRCGCGEPLAKRERYCGRCREARRRQSRREAARRWRSQRNQLTAANRGS